MSDLYGLPCVNPKCVHDNTTGYQMHFWVRPDRASRPQNFTEGQWVMKRPWRRERNPVIFRATELVSAYEQLTLLGAEPGLGMQIIEGSRTPNLPPGYDARRLLLLEIPMPKIAVYFRFRPDAGEWLTPDRVFQCHFPPGSTPAERRMAIEIPLSPELFMHIFRRKEVWVGSPIQQVRNDTAFRCQHCQEPVPLRFLNTITLREVEKGD